MNVAKTCYVSIAFGMKPDAETGHLVDYERVYSELIVPAVERAGLTCLRADSFTGALIHKDIAKAVITADVMIADVSSGSANVMYELGLRHALRRGSTVLVTSTRLPFNISYSYALRYELAADGTLDSARAEAFRAQLSGLLAAKVERVSTDSPIYEYFPDLSVSFPADLQPPETRRRSYPVEAQATRGPDRKTAVARAEQATRSATDADPQAFLDVLRRYRDLGAWEDVVRLGNELPADVAQLPQVVQSVAMAYNRLGDTDRAIEILSRHVDRSGGDPETHGLLGSLYKKRHFTDHSTATLQAAIDHYRQGFERNPEDLYLGRNLAQLLHRLGSPQSRAELAQLLPPLRRLARARVADPLPDFWLLDSALVLALLDGDPATADSLADRMMALHPDPWMLDASRAELTGVMERAADEAQRALVQAAINRLAATAFGDAEEADDAQL